MGWCIVLQVFLWVHAHMYWHLLCQQHFTGLTAWVVRLTSDRTPPMISHPQLCCPTSVASAGFSSLPWFGVLRAKPWTTFSAHSFTILWAIMCHPPNYGSPAPFRLPSSNLTTQLPPVFSLTCLTGTPNLLWMKLRYWSLSFKICHLDPKCQNDHEAPLSQSIFVLKIRMKWAWPSVPPELTLGHLCYHLTGVLPQSDSPPGTVPGAGHLAPEVRPPQGLLPPPAGQWKDSEWWYFLWPSSELGASIPWIVIWYLPLLAPLIQLSYAVNSACKYSLMLWYPPFIQSKMHGCQ